MVGIRLGEKLHEKMISIEDAYRTSEYPEPYKILSQFNNWDKVTNHIKDEKNTITLFIPVITIVNG